MDTLITIAIVATAAVWAALGAWRRATAKAASCAGGCAGCGRGRDLRPAVPACPEGSDTGFRRTGAEAGIPLPSRSEKRG